MLRYILIGTIVSIAILFSVAAYFKFGSRPTSNLPDRRIEISEKTQDHAVLQLVNKNNNQIRSFSCDDVEIKIWERGHRFKLKGAMYYEKTMNFHLYINSIFGKEADIGSNQKTFWYWSKRDRHSALYWATHEDYAKTRLKTPFNPVFLKAALGMDALSSEDVRITESHKDLMATYLRQNATGQKVLYSVIINKGTNQIDGYFLSDLGGKTLAVCEIQERDGNLPTKILFTWNEESKVMLLTFKNPAINAPISPEHWSLPMITPQVNMADE